MNALQSIGRWITLLLLLVGVSACGSSSSSNSSSGSGGGAYGSGSGSSGGGGARTILAKEQDEKYLFTPALASVSKGATVTWTNKTDAEHSVTFDSGATFDKDFEEGEHVTYTFSNPGTYRYHCKYHPYMKGVVTVKA